MKGHTARTKGGVSHKGHPLAHSALPVWMCCLKTCHSAPVAHRNVDLRPLWMEAHRRTWWYGLELCSEQKPKPHWDTRSPDAGLVLCSVVSVWISSLERHSSKLGKMDAPPTKRPLCLPHRWESPPARGCSVSHPHTSLCWSDRYVWVVKEEWGMGFLFMVL